MADFPIYRLVKGSQLTFTEMDGNFEWLSRNMSGSVVTITGSLVGITGSVSIIGDVQITGTASIGFINSQGYSTGSNQLGDDTLDTQTLVGLVRISGSLNVSGSTFINNLTGSLFGTSSQALSSSYAVSSSFSPQQLNGSGYVSMSGATTNYVSTIPNSGLTNSLITIQGSATSLGGSINIINGTGFVKASGTSITYDNNTYYLTSNPSFYIALTALSATSPLSYNNGSGAFTISQANASTNGFLSSTDWSTFNNKQATLSLTTTGTSGAATFSANTLNVPQYSDTNIYNTNGSLTSARTLTHAGFNLSLIGSVHTNVFSTTGRVLLGNPTESTFLLDVNGSARVNNLFIPSVGNAVQTTKSLHIYNGNDVFYVLPSGGQTELFMRGNNPSLFLWYYSIVADYNITHSAGPYVDNMFFKMNSGNTLTLKRSGNLIINGTTDIASAILQINSINKGVLFPRMTTSERNAIVSPATGLQVYNTTTNENNVYNGTAWLGQQSAISLTTTGTSGAATFSANTLNIPNYTLAGLGGLPLTGGTLTGALNGTSATFSGNMSVNAEGTFIGIDAQALPRLGFVKLSGAQPFIGFASDPIKIKVSSGANIANTNTFADVLSIQTTGAATFSSTVAMQGLTATTGNFTGALTGTSATFSGNVTTQQASNPQISIIATSASGVSELYLNRSTSTIVGYLGAGVNSTVSNVGDFVVLENRLSTGGIALRTNNSTALTIASTGAATFSSTVQATTLKTANISGGSSAQPFKVGSLTTGIAFSNNSMLELEINGVPVSIPCVNLTLL